RRAVSSHPSRISTTLYAGTTAAIPMFEGATAILAVSRAITGCSSRKVVRRTRSRLLPSRSRPIPAIPPEIGEVRVFGKREPLASQRADDVRVAHARLDLRLDHWQ